MEAVMARLTPDADAEACRIEGCSKEAAFQVIKMRDDGSPQQEFFCEKHGQEYAMRGHLVISENV
jgi:hypothetical protein